MARVERLGKYELLRHLASGGMARVYLARVEGVGGFQRHLVLKTVRPERTEDSSYVAMFLDEARLIATLHHQHIAQVYDIGVADDGTYFLAMEYLHGETMRHVLERARDLRQRLPLDFSLTVVAAAAAGLHHAHERRGPDGRPLGIVHRDVTPSNVIAGYDGSVKLIDFGIAKAAERSTQTKTGFIKGKAGYMAPEQALGHPVDRRADVFSLGVMLYELTTQTRAFPAASELEIAHRIVRGEVTPPSVAVAGYPTELEDVVMSALARDPDERFGDADALAHAVSYAASHLGVALGPAAVSRVLGQLFGSRPEPWLTEEAEEEEIDFSRTGDTASLLDSRPLLATSSEALGFARGTGAQDSAARASSEVAVPPPTPAPPPAPQIEIIDDDDEDGDEMPTVKFVALDEAEIIIESGPSRSGVRVPPGQTAGQSVARVLAPLPGLTEPPPPARLITKTPTGPASMTPTPRPAPVLTPPGPPPPAASTSPPAASASPPAPPSTAPPIPTHAHPQIPSPASDPVPRPTPNRLTPPPRPAVGSKPPPFERTPTPAPSTRPPTNTAAPSLTKGTPPANALPTIAAGSTSSPMPTPPTKSGPNAVGASQSGAHAVPQPVGASPAAPHAVAPSATPIAAPGAPLTPHPIPMGPMPEPPPSLSLGSPMPGATLPRAVTARPVTSPLTVPPSAIGMRTEEVMAFSTFEASARRKRILIPLVIGAALALVVIIVLIKVLGGSDETVTPAQPLAADLTGAVTPPAVATTPPPPKPTETNTIKVHVTSSPDDATVMLDGERLGRTPLTVERPRQAGPVWLKVRKKGYSTRKIQVDLGADVTWDIRLPKSD